MDQKKKKSSLLNIFVNIVIPIIVLTKFSGDEFLGAKWGFVVALIFPLIYGFWEFRNDKNVNVFSGLGVISVLLTGGIGFFELPNSLLALKEASVPFVVGIILIVSHKIGRSLFVKLLGEALDLDKIFKIAREKNKYEALKRDISISNYILAIVFFASAIVNYVLAKIIVVSSPGTAAYNEELGVLTGLSFMVIFIPFLIAFILIIGFLITRIKNKTGLKLEEILF